MPEYRNDDAVAQDPDFPARLLFALAAAADTHLFNEHYGFINGEEAPKPEDDEPLDVKIGDVVYFYDEDEDCVLACPVVCKYDRHFYAVICAEDAKPMIRAVTDYFHTTAEAAAEEFHDEIESSVKYHKARFERARMAQRLLSKKE